MPLAIVLAEDEAREGAIPRAALGIGGVAMTVAPGLSFGLQQAAGVGALLAAMALSAFSMIYLRRLQAEQSGSGVRDAEYRRADFGAGAERLVTSAAIQLAVASVLLAMSALSSGIGPLAPVHLNDVAALPLAVLAIVVSAGMLPLFLWLLGRLPAWQAATLQWMSTLVAVGEGAWFVHVRPAAEGWIGAALVAGCIVSVLRMRTVGEISGISGNVAEEAILGPGAGRVR